MHPLVEQLPTALCSGTSLGVKQLQIWPRFSARRWSAARHQAAIDGTRQARCRLKQPGILAMQMGQGEALVGFGRPGRGLHCLAAICDCQGAFGSALA